MNEAVMRQLRAGFHEEARELAEQLTRAILSLERTGEAAAHDEAFAGAVRALHTLKGSAATLSLNELSGLAHAMETLLARHRAAGALPVSVGDALLASLDDFLERARAEAEGAPSLPELGAALKRVAEAGGASPDAPAPALTPRGTRAVQPGADPDEGSWRISGRDVAEVSREVERIRELRLRLRTRAQETEAASALLLRARGVPAADDARAALESALARLQADEELAGEILGALEASVRSISTLPVSTLVGALDRAVRDLCRSLEKEARLTVVGGELALDRRLLQALRGPLLHLVRNAVDHGVETPAVRQSRGKHREAVITVRAQLHGNVLRLEVSDDGGGIEFDRVRERALQLGLAAPDALAQASEAELTPYLFGSGFSTRSVVSETSGRGVGLDVVQAEVGELGGTVEVHSTPGEGTRFTVTLPSELGSSPLMLVRSAGHVVAVPIAAVESVSFVRDRIRVAAQRLELDTGREVVTAIDLGALLGARAPVAPRAEDAMVVLHAHARRVALVLDEVLGHDELMVRPLPAELAAGAHFQGAAALPSGELVLVLRPEWLVQAQAPALTRAARQVRRALVVDDSVSARAFHRNLLQAAGFEVGTAASGEEALAELGRRPFSLVVCDLGMEPMSGEALIRRIRGVPAWSDTAIVVVSGRDTPPEDLTGMDAFVTKRDCASGKLLDAAQAAMAARSRA